MGVNIINMNITIIFLAISMLLIAGCASIEKKKEMPPSVSTERVIQSLNDTKDDLEQAGQSNTKVAANIDKALTLAQRLDVLLDQIEKEQQSLTNKNIIKPIK
jgi:outer membrane murein-binding lipoprotein Lpp